MGGRLERRHKHERMRVLVEWLSEDGPRGPRGGDVPERIALRALIDLLPVDRPGRGGPLAALMTPERRHDVRTAVPRLDATSRRTLEASGYAALFDIQPHWSRSGLDTLARLLPAPGIDDGQALDLLSLMRCEPPFTAMGMGPEPGDVPRTLRRFAGMRDRDDIPVVRTVTDGLRRLEILGVTPRSLEVEHGVTAALQVVWTVGVMPPEWVDTDLVRIAASLHSCRAHGARVDDLVRGSGGRWKALLDRVVRIGGGRPVDVGDPLVALDTAVRTDVRERTGAISFGIDGDGWKRSLWEAFHGRAGLVAVARKTRSWHEDTAFLPRDQDEVRWPVPDDGDDIGFLASTTDLFREGRDMDHCVARIASRYASGARWVARLRVDGRRATAEGTFDGRVLQCRTHGNHEAPWAMDIAHEAAAIATRWRVGKPDAVDRYEVSARALADAQRVGEWSDWARYLSGPTVDRPFDHPAFDWVRDVVLSPTALGPLRFDGPPGTGRPPVRVEEVFPENLVGPT